jgi:hypothetical protein
LIFAPAVRNFREIPAKKSRRSIFPAMIAESIDHGVAGEGGDADSCRPLA